MATHIDQSEVNDLVAGIYSAAMMPRKWPWVLAQLSEMLNHNRVQIFGHDMDVQCSLGHITHGYDPEFLRSFDAYYGAHNVWANSFHSKPVGTVITTRDTIADEDIRKTEFYADWVRPQEDMIAGTGTILVRDSQRLVAFGCNLRARDEDALLEPASALVQLLLPHLQQALEITRSLGGLSLENRVLRTGLEPHLAGVFTLDADMRILYSNTVGDRLLNGGAVVQKTLRARLRFTDDNATRALKRGVFAMRNGDMPLAAPFFAQGRNGRNYLCRAVPVGPEASAPLLPSPLAAPNAGTLLLLVSPCDMAMATARKGGAEPMSRV